MEIRAFRWLGIIMLCLLYLALPKEGEAHKTYVGVKANVEPMYSTFHTGDKIRVRCYAAGDTTIPNIYFTWKTGFADPIRLRTGNPPGVVIRMWRMDMPNTAVSEMTMDRTFYNQMVYGDNIFQCIAISRDGQDPVTFTIQKTI